MWFVFTLGISPLAGCCFNVRQRKNTLEEDLGRGDSSRSKPTLNQRRVTEVSESKKLSRQERRRQEKQKEIIYTCKSCGFSTYPKPIIDPIDGHLWYSIPKWCPSCGRGLVRRVIPK